MLVYTHDNFLLRKIELSLPSGYTAERKDVFDKVIDIVAHKTQKNVRAPKFIPATESDYADFADYACKTCFSFEESADAEAKIAAAFGAVKTVTVDGRVAFIGDKMTEKEADEKIAKCGLTLVSRIRVL